MSRASAILALSCVCLASSAFFSGAQAEAIRFENSDLHYSLTAPDGWVRMPDEVLKTRGNPEGSSEPPPVAGFQKPAKTWFHVPALVINHAPGDGQRPRDLYEELTHDKEVFQQGGRLVYDDKRGMVMIVEKNDSTDGGEIQRLSVFKPGTKGTVHLDFYVPVGEMPVYVEPTVTKVLDSFRFEPGFAVVDLMPGESRPLGEDMARVLRQKPRILFMTLLGLITVIASIVSTRRKRKQP